MENPSRPSRSPRPHPALTSLLLGLIACDEGASPAPSPSDTRCGSGALTLALGIDRPFAPHEGPFAIEAGLQGGYHFDVSIRSQGALDPDHVDVELTLLQDGIARARHLTADWLLTIDGNGPWCDYTKARLVLVGEDGGLLPRERLSEVVAGPLVLEVKLDSPAGSGEATLPIELELTPGI